MTITMDGEYQARDGRKVRVLCVDATPKWPVVALIEGDEIPETYKLDGRCFDGSECLSDLIEAPRKFSGWINLYAPKVGGCYEFDAGCVYPDKATADKEAEPGRVACLHLNFTERDGL